MFIILVGFLLLPALLGLIAEYAACRLTMARRRWLRLLPPLLLAALTALTAAWRYRVWTAPESPLAQLLFVPGLPALGAAVGLLLGWRLWKRLWGPRVIRDPDRKKK